MGKPKQPRSTSPPGSPVRDAPAEKAARTAEPIEGLDEATPSEPVSQRRKLSDLQEILAGNMPPVNMEALRVLWQALRDLCGECEGQHSVLGKLLRQLAEKDQEIRELKQAVQALRQQNSQHGDTLQQLARFQADERVRSIVVSAPRGLSVEAVKEVIFKLGGHEVHESMGVASLGAPKPRQAAGTSGQVAQEDRQLIRFTARSRVIYDILDQAWRLQHKEGYQQVYINESLDLPLRQRKKAILGSEAYKQEKAGLAALHRVVRWREGLPYTAPKQAASGAPLTPMKVALPYLQEGAGGAGAGEGVRTSSYAEAAAGRTAAADGMAGAGGSGVVASGVAASGMAVPGVAMAGAEVPAPADVSAVLGSATTAATTNAAAVANGGPGPSGTAGVTTAGAATAGQSSGAASTTPYPPPPTTDVNGLPATIPGAQP